MIDFTDVKAVTLGGQSVKQIARGSDVLWKAGGPEPVGPDYLYFEAAEAGSTVSMEKVGSAPSVGLEYSTDKVVWSPFIVGSTVVTLAKLGDKVYLRGNNTSFASSASKYNKFVMTGKINCGGELMSLFDKTVELRAFTADYAAAFLFYDCTSLLSSPKLSATSITKYCYYRLFSGCSSLASAPESLPAATLLQGCYSSMFRDCSALVTAPHLVAALPVNQCYNNMFSGCSALQEIRVALVTWQDAQYACTTTWVDNVAAEGTFYCRSTLPNTRGVDNIPTGWAKVDWSPS